MGQRHLADKAADAHHYMGVPELLKGLEERRVRDNEGHNSRRQHDGRRFRGRTRKLDDFSTSDADALDFINEDMMRIGILRSGFHALHPQFLLPTQPPASKAASQISVNCNPLFPFASSRKSLSVKVPVAAFFTRKREPFDFKGAAFRKQSSDGNRFLATSNCSVNLAKSALCCFFQFGRVRFTHGALRCPSGLAPSTLIVQATS